MDLEWEFECSKRRLAAGVRRDVAAALSRINELTETEWAEVEAGLREHPHAAAAREAAGGFVELGRMWRSVAESVKAAVEAFNRGFSG